MFFKDKYKVMGREAHIRGQFIPSISCQKDERNLRGNRYRSSALGDGIFRLQTSDYDISDKTYRHGVYFDGKICFHSFVYTYNFDKYKDINFYRT
jgi:hypothetical protein